MFFEDQLKHCAYEVSSWCIMEPDTWRCADDLHEQCAKCGTCRQYFDERKGKPIPKELQSTRFDNFNTWKVFQYIEYNRLSGRYTDEQAEIARKHYADQLLKFLESEREQQEKAGESKKLIDQLFNS